MRLQTRFLSICGCIALALLLVLCAPVSDAKIISMVKSYKCSGNGKTIEQNLIDHYSKEGITPIRMDWTYKPQVRRVNCCVVLSKEIANKFPGPISEGKWSSFDSARQQRDVHLFQFNVKYPIPHIRGFYVCALGWHAVEVFPGMEPSGILLDEDESNFYVQWAHFGRTFAISQVPAERFRWQIRNGGNNEKRMSFEVDSGVHPELVFWSLSTMEDQNEPFECRNNAANELFSLTELPDGVVGDLTRMFASTDEDEVWRDYCLQFLGSALEREDGVTDEDRALARETLVEALDSTNATFAGTALRALHRGDPADPLVASNALRIARDPSYPSASRTAALLVLEECSSLGVDGEAVTPEERRSVLRETAEAIVHDPTATALLLQTAEAVLKRIAD